MRHRLICASAILLAGASASAQTPPPSAAAPARLTCDASEFRQLDFWVGRWKVSNRANGTPVGTSRIEKVMGGCAIGEHYEAPGAPGGPYSGTSYSGYDRKDGHWHQMYVDTNGTLAWFTGALEGRDMVLNTTGPNNSPRRMTYSPQPDGSVRQFGNFSTDGGKSWQTGYDYIYRRE
jgi:hypothetical protein